MPRKPKPQYHVSTTGTIQVDVVGKVGKPLPLQAIFDFVDECRAVGLDTSSEVMTKTHRDVGFTGTYEFRPCLTVTAEAEII